MKQIVNTSGNVFIFDAKLYNKTINADPLVSDKHIPEEKAFANP